MRKTLKKQAQRFSWSEWAFSGKPPQRKLSPKERVEKLKKAKKRRIYWLDQLDWEVSSLHSENHDVLLYVQCLESEPNNLSYFISLKEAFGRRDDWLQQVFEHLDLLIEYDIMPTQTIHEIELRF